MRNMRLRRMHVSNVCGRLDRVNAATIFQGDQREVRYRTSRMSVLEVETFEVNPDITRDDFLVLDAQMQEWCYLNRSGLARRTTARNDDGTYIVITLFDDASRIDSTYNTRGDNVVRTWCAAIKESSRRVSVYLLL